MKLPLILLVSLALACKPQEQKQQTGPVLQSISDYKPNPDDVVLYLTLLESNQSDNGWDSKVEVKRQMRAGFGYKNRLSPGEVITLSSKEKLPDGDFYCAVEYSETPNGGRYSFKTLLKK